jgi:histidine ammonia-lyase
VRRTIPPLDDDRYMADELRAAAAMVMSAEVAEAAGADVLPVLDPSPGSRA